jgi:imidazolonepropionase-like amidohydrolase
MAENGMTPMESLVAGTSAAADLLGIADEVGTVEAGKVADLVAVAGDPLQNIEIVTRPVFVMHEGRIHKQE